MPKAHSLIKLTNGCNIIMPKRKVKTLPHIKITKMLGVGKSKKTTSYYYKNKKELNLILSYIKESEKIDSLKIDIKTQTKIAEDGEVSLAKRARAEKKAKSLEVRLEKTIKNRDKKHLKMASTLTKIVTKTYNKVGKLLHSEKLQLVSPKEEPTELKIYEGKKYYTKDVMVSYMITGEISPVGVNESGKWVTENMVMRMKVPSGYEIDSYIKSRLPYYRGDENEVVIVGIQIMSSRVNKGLTKTTRRGKRS